LKEQTELTSLCIQMPAPCKNCLRFHYGPCWEAKKVCHCCGGINHIERYCPSNNRNGIKATRGEPLPGTRQWCEMYGLDNDPELKRKILTALKTSPSSAIYVNGVCLYAGTDKHFETDELPRGRTMKDRINRERSRSASPNRGRSPPRDRSPMYQPRYRSRSPVRHRRRTPSPYRDLDYSRVSPPPYYQPERDQCYSRDPSYGRLTPERWGEPEYKARSPRYAPDSNVVGFEARDRASQNRPAPLPASTVKFNIPNVVRKAAAVPPVFTSANAVPVRGPLGNVTNAGNQSAAPAQGFASLIKVSGSQQPAPAVPASPAGREVEDPHWVLGVTKQAGEAE
jgi:hypothetical protein